MLDRDHETLRFACPCSGCNYVLELEASAIDVARYANVIPLSARRAATGSR